MARMAEGILSRWWRRRTRGWTRWRRPWWGWGGRRWIRTQWRFRVLDSWTDNCGLGWSPCAGWVLLVFNHLTLHLICYSNSFYFYFFTKIFSKKDVSFLWLIDFWMLFHLPPLYGNHGECTLGTWWKTLLRISSIEKNGCTFFFIKQHTLYITSYFLLFYFFPIFTFYFYSTEKTGALSSL